MIRSIDELRHQFITRQILPTAWLGDSPERFDTYAGYASQVKSVVEFGVYTGLSTTAWLWGRPQKIRSYDITDENFSVRDELEKFAIDNNIDFQFEIGNSLEVTIEPCDLLFLDTVHKKHHVAAELNRHAPFTRKFIVLHDTTAFPGVFQAIADFVIGNHDWRIIEHCNRDSGLVVLERWR